MERRLGGIHRKDPMAMEELVQMFIRSMKLSAGLNTRRIFEAWDAVSGAARHTQRRFFRLFYRLCLWLRLLRIA